MRASNWVNFNPRSHERSDKCGGLSTWEILYFNPRSHERSDKWRICREVFETGFQSTLPREERPSTVEPYSSIDDISIHAPTRGATQSPCMFLQGSCYFNPRSHERSDFQCIYNFLSMLISIHAPTRGATDFRIVVRSW